MSLPEIDLPKLAGAAASAVGLVIATAILLGWVTSRYTPTFDQYRALTAELRVYEDQTRRRDALRKQIDGYRRRLLHLNRASALLGWVLVCAIVTILAASLTMMFPGHGYLALGGAVTLFTALAADVVAVGLVLAENQIDRRAILEEAEDIDEVNGGPPDGADGR